MDTQNIHNLRWRDKVILTINHKIRALLRNHSRLKDLFVRSTESFIPQPKEVVVSSTLYGFRMIINPCSDEIIGRSIYYNGTYEAGTIYILGKCLSAGDTYLDIGSNIGLMALYASKRVGRTGTVFAFEPEPAIFHTLTANIELNHFTNINPVQIGLGSSAGTATIYNSESNRGAASLIPSDALTGHKSEIKIERLDDFVIEKSIDTVRMMKIDVEGWELEVLKGGRNLLNRDDSPILCIECSQLRPMHGGTTEDIFTFVSEINQYQVFRLLRGKGRPSKLVQVKSHDDLPRHDNLFCFLPDHLKTIDKRLFMD